MPTPKTTAKLAAITPNVFFDLWNWNIVKFFITHSIHPPLKFDAIHP